MDRIDLVAMRGNRFMRVQVKAANPKTFVGRQPRYNFMTNDGCGGTLSPDYIDIVALVAIDIRKVIFEVPADLKLNSSVSPCKYLQIDIERITWDNAVTRILGEAHDVCSGPEVA